MLAWLNTTADWAGPIAAILNFIIAAVGLPIAIWKGLKARKVIVAWFASVLGSTQHASDRSTDAETAARASVAASETAAERAESARDNSRQANELLEWAIPELMRRDAVIEDLRTRIDRLLGTRARQLAVEHPAPVAVTSPALLIPAAAGDDSDQLTETGRHRLHTQRFTTIDEGDHP